MTLDRITSNLNRMNEQPSIRNRRLPCVAQSKG